MSAFDTYINSILPDATYPRRSIRIAYKQICDASYNEDKFLADTISTLCMKHDITYTAELLADYKEYDAIGDILEIVCLQHGYTYSDKLIDVYRDFARTNVVYNCDDLKTRVLFWALHHPSSPIVHEKEKRRIDRRIQCYCRNNRIEYFKELPAHYIEWCHTHEVLDSKDTLNKYFATLKKIIVRE